MGKFKGFILVSLALFFMLPAFAHADDLNYDVLVRGFFWAANTSTPTTKNNSTAGYGASVDVGGKPNSEFANWGFTGEFTSTPNGPRFVNTGGNFATSFNGQPGFPVPLGGGTFGLIVPGTFQLGGAKIKYFFPTPLKTAKFALYADYFSITGGLSALGGGGEVDWNFNSNWEADGFLDWNNATGNGAPTQTLVRYQATIGYNLPQTSLQLFAGYRGYALTNFYNTYINGFIAGLGARF